MTKINYKDLEKKIDDRLQKPFFTDMLILAAATGTDHFKYKAKIKELALFIRDKLQERNLIKKLKYRPKEFWNFNGKKSIYNIDGGQLSLSVTGAAALGLRVGVYRVKPGDKSDQREASSESTTLTANLIDSTTSHYEQDDDTFMIEYNKMLTGTRMIMETAEVVKQIGGKGEWKEKPNSNDIIYLHGPIVYEATMYHLATEERKSSRDRGVENEMPPYKEEFCKKILTHQNNKTLKKEDRYFIPLYVEITNQIKKSKVPIYGVVERSGGISSPGPVTRAVLGELYHVSERIGFNNYPNSQHLTNSWNIRKAGDRDTYEKLVKEFSQRPISDAVLFDLILDEGEYIQPVQIVKNPYNKWPRSCATLHKLMPEPFSTFLKVSELKRPIKIETLNVLESYDKDIDFTYHSTKLLPEYCFPLGLNIIDKMTKVPSWMRSSMRNEYQRFILKKTIETGNKDYVNMALKSLFSGRKGWNRP